MGFQLHPKIPTLKPYRARDLVNTEPLRICWRHLPDRSRPSPSTGVFLDELIAPVQRNKGNVSKKDFLWYKHMDSYGSIMYNLFVFS